MTEVFNIMWATSLEEARSILETYSPMKYGKDWHSADVILYETRFDNDQSALDFLRDNLLPNKISVCECGMNRFAYMYLDNHIKDDS